MTRDNDNQSVENEVLFDVLLAKDIRKIVDTLQPKEVRCLVDYYYTMQKLRVGGFNRVRALTKDEEPHGVLSWMAERAEHLEAQIHKVLAVYSKRSELGQWARSIMGVGPVITAGLLAHIDFSIATNPSKIWRFAGLDPTQTWGKGEKRPWNARLKTLLWKMGESFKRLSTRDEKFLADERSLYVRLYLERKKLEVERNESGVFKERAAVYLKTKNWKKGSPPYLSYSEGRLPAGQLDRRACRYATKIFLSHFWVVNYELVNLGKKAPNPWIIEHGGHTDLIQVPNWKRC